MRNTILISLSAIATSGCIIYDNDGPNRGKDNQIDAIETGETDEIELDLVFSPPQAEVGESFIGTITVELTADGEEVSLSEVSDVIVYGDATVSSIFPREDEVLVSISIDEDAIDGEVDIIVEFNDGSAAFLEAALTLFPEGSGNSASDWQMGDVEDEHESASAEDELPCP
jgi:hypothetical protein